MRLTTASPYFLDDDIWMYCDPYNQQSWTNARDCEVPQWPRLVIGGGTIAASPELLELVWQAQRWELYLDGRQVDVAAFGTLPDSHYFEPALGIEVWLRQWAVTLVNPTPGQHTLRYLVYQSPAGDEPAGTYYTTWTFTVIP